MLKAYWNLDGNAFDSSGNGYNGTINGTAVWVPGHIGTDTALKFDGTTTYIDAGTLLNLTGQFTILSWNKLGTGIGWREIISKGESANDIYHNYYISFKNYDLHFGFGDGVNYRGIEVLNAVSDLNWHHIAVVFVSSTDIRVYVDGIQKIGTYSGTATTLTPNTRRTIIGGIGSTIEFLHDGALQEIKVHDTALTQADILADYNASTTIDIEQNSTHIVILNATGQSPYTYKLKVGGVELISFGPTTNPTQQFSIQFAFSLGLHTLSADMTDSCNDPSPQTATAQTIINIVPATGCPVPLVNIQFSDASESAHHPSTNAG